MERQARPASVAIVALLLGWSAVASAGAPAPVPSGPGPHRPEHQVANLGDVRFEGGETVREFKVTYVTHGKLSPKKDNVILVTDSFTSDHHAFDFVIGPGKALDTDRYFIVAVDGLGNPNLRHELTTGPTSSGMKMEFPRYTMRDAVNVELRLLKEHLGIERVVAAIGGSLGAMKGFQLGVSHPASVSGIIAVAGGPATSPLVKTVIKNWMDIIALDPAWHGGNYEANPTTGLVTALMNFVPWLYGPQWFEANARTLDDYRRFRRRWHEIFTVRRPMDARDIYYRWQSWADFNVGDTPGFKGDTKAALRSIKAQVLIIGSKDDLLVHRSELVGAKDAIPNATLIEIDSPLGHLAPLGFDPEGTKVMEREITKFLSKLR